MPEEERENIYEAIVKVQDELIPFQGGTLYKGVQEGIKALSRKYLLFMVSNCSKDTIRQFLQ